MRPADAASTTKEERSLLPASACISRPRTCAPLVALQRRDLIMPRRAAEHIISGDGRGLGFRSADVPGSRASDRI